MIFAAETEERTLHVFPDADTASSYCDGRDVESTLWLFWDDDGAPLQPEFTIPNKRGFLVSTTGIYHLVPALDSQRAALAESLFQIRQVIGEVPFTSVAAIARYLDAKLTHHPGKAGQVEIAAADQDADPFAR